MSDTNFKVITAAFSQDLNAATAGLLGAGQRLANDAGGTHIAICCGSIDSALATQISAFADRVIAIDSEPLARAEPEAWLSCLRAISAQESPDAVLLGNNTLSQEITPRLAHRLNGASIGDAQSVTIDDGAIVITRSVYGGKAIADIELTASPAVVWIRAQSMDPADKNAAPGTIETAPLNESADLQCHIIDTHDEVSEGERLEDAQIIVSGGRGLGGPEPFEELVSLAKVLKAQNAASRAACDLGWVPHSWQVGQTGRKVAPQLYLAVAISGASQHMMGIADSKAIAAINTDRDAPIFKHCQFGLVEDFQQVVGPLRDKLSDLL